MYSLSFHLCFSSNHPAPLNLNESSGSDKGRPYNPQQVQGRIREILGKYSNGFWVSKLPQIYRELYKQDLPTEAIKDLETWTHICTVCTLYVIAVINYVAIMGHHLAQLVERGVPCAEALSLLQPTRIRLPAWVTLLRVTPPLSHPVSCHLFS